MTTREIVSLQIGHFANFVGTHWWNIQESSFQYSHPTETLLKEVNHDILFREGQTLQGEVTYTPRLVAVDLKGSLKSLRSEGILYESGQEEEVKWDADVALHEALPVEKNDFLEDLDKVEAEQIPSVTAETEGNSKLDIETGKDGAEAGVIGRKLYDLDNTVSVWSDFLRLHLHPKSLRLVQEYTHEDSERPFDVFNFGCHMMSNVETNDALENQIRFFVEECDQLQGFHMLLDWCDGFGGLGATMLQYLDDEFSSKARFTIGVSSAHLPDATARQRASRIINCALCMDKASSLSSLFLPLSLSETLWKKVGPPRSLPHINYKHDLNYHTSAILAASLDTMTLPYRRDGFSTHLADITGSFNSHGRKISTLQSSLPFPLYDQGSCVESLLSHKDQPPWVSLTPHVGLSPSPVLSPSLSPFMQSTVLRGIPPTRINRSNPSANLPLLLSGCSNLDEILQIYLSEMYAGTMNAGCVIQDPCKVVSPYPYIFSPGVSKYGLLSDTNRPSSQCVDSIPMMTSLQSSSAPRQLLNSLHEESSRLNIRKHHQYLEAGLEEDQYAETVEALAEHAQCY